jgi:hypothetical protein
MISASVLALRRALSTSFSALDDRRICQGPNPLADARVRDLEIGCTYSYEEEILAGVEPCKYSCLNSFTTESRRIG